MRARRWLRIEDLRTNRGDEPGSKLPRASWCRQQPVYRAGTIRIRVQRSGSTARQAQNKFTRFGIGPGTNHRYRSRPSFASPGGSARQTTGPARASVLRVASSLYPEDYEVHRQLAWSLRKLDAPVRGGGRGVQKALALNPWDPEALGMLGGVYKRLQPDSEAKSCYDQAADSPPPVSTRARQSSGDGDIRLTRSPETGVAHYRALLKSLEKRQGAADVWGALVAGEAAFAVGDQDAAADWFGRARQLSTDPVPFESAPDQLTLFGQVGFRTDAAARHSRSLREHVERLQGRVQLPASARAVPAAREKPPVLIHLSICILGPGAARTPRRCIDSEMATDNQPLIRHLERQFNGPQASFWYDADRLHLIVSGDLTYSADSSEFRTACEFLVQMSSALGISRERVHLVPGNHDVHWPSSAIHPSHRFDNYIGFLDDFFGSTLLRTRYPFLKWDLRTNSQRDAPEVSCRSTRPIKSSWWG